MQLGWWTLAIQAVNVLILVWLLKRFFYRPLLGIIDRRRAATEKLLADAQATQAQAEAARQDIAAARAGIGEERDRMLAQARGQIAAEREAMHKQADAEIAGRRADSDASAARARRAMEAQMAGKAAQLAVKIAARLVAKHPVPQAADDRLRDVVAGLPQRSRALLAAAAQDGKLTIASASALDEATQRACGLALGKALGVAARPAFVSAPELIAGFELRTESLVVKDNWRDDLSQILENLEAMDGQQQVS